MKCSRLGLDYCSVVRFKWRAFSRSRRLLFSRSSGSNGRHFFGGLGRGGLQFFSLRTFVPLRSSRHANRWRRRFCSSTLGAEGLPHSRCSGRRTEKGPAVRSAATGLPDSVVARATRLEDVEVSRKPELNLVNARGRQRRRRWRGQRQSR